MSERDVKSTREGGGPFALPIRDEMYSRMHAMIEGGRSSLEIARRLGVCSRTVNRYRKRIGAANFYGRNAA